MILKDIMSLDLWVIEPDEAISSAVWKMETGGVGVFSDISMAMKPPMLHLMVGMGTSRRAKRAMPV